MHRPCVRCSTLNFLLQVLDTRLSCGKTVMDASECDDAHVHVRCAETLWTDRCKSGYLSPVLIDVFLFHFSCLKNGVDHRFPANRQTSKDEEERGR